MSENLTEIFADYLMDFPESERKSIPQIIQLIEHDWYQIYAYYEAGVRVGYAFIDVDIREKNLWLEYFAVSAGHRGQGIGQRILTSIKETFKEYQGIYFEIEAVVAELPMTVKRQRFYEHLGAYLVTKDYILPNETGGEILWLYYMPIQKEDVNIGSLIQTMTYLYSYVHSDIGEMHQFLNKNIEALQKERI